MELYFKASKEFREVFNWCPPIKGERCKLRTQISTLIEGLGLRDLEEIKSLVDKMLDGKYQRSQYPQVFR